MSAMTVYIQSRITDAEGYRALAKTLTEMVREEEPGTLIYEWHLSPDGSNALNIDGYDSTESFLAHMQHVQERGHLDRFLAICDIERIQVTGSPSPAADELIEQFGAEVLEEVDAV